MTHRQTPLRIDARFPGPIVLDHGQKLTNINLQLPPRLPLRSVHVRVLWQDGRSADDASVFGFACRTCCVRMPMAAFPRRRCGEGCEIGAEVKLDAGGHANSNTVVVPPGGDPFSVVLILH